MGVIFSNGGRLINEGVISGGATGTGAQGNGSAGAGVVMQGSGQWTMDTPLDYTGGTTVEADTLAVANAEAQLEVAVTFKFRKPCSPWP